MHGELVGGETNYCKTMGDEDDGCVGKLLFDVFQQTMLCLHVERRCSFVKEQHAAWAYQCAGYGYTLRLTFGQSATLLSTHSVQSVRQLEHEIRHSGIKRPAHLLLRSSWVPHKQVVAYGSAKESVSLWHV